MSRIYLRDPSLAPEGVQLHHGPAGGVWYNSEDRQVDRGQGGEDDDTKIENPSRDSGSARTTNQTPGGGEPGDTGRDGGPPAGAAGSPDPADFRVWVFSDAVSVAISFVGGRIQIIHSNSSESTAVAREVVRRAIQSEDPVAFQDAALAIARERGLNTSQL